MSSYNNVTKFRLLPIVLSILATVILLNDVVSAKKLAGANLAQSDFGVFFDFVVYVIPSILLVVYFLIQYIKAIVRPGIRITTILNDWYVLVSLVAVIVPITIFIFS